MWKMDCFPRKQFIDVPIKMIYASRRTFSISSIRPNILQPVTVIGRITRYLLPGGQHFQAECYYILFVGSCLEDVIHMFLQALELFTLEYRLTSCPASQSSPQFYTNPYLKKNRSNLRTQFLSERRAAAIHTVPNYIKSKF